MTNFEQFRQARKWFFSKDAAVEIVNEQLELPLSVTFKKLFPLFTLLIDQAEITAALINGRLYRLFAWHKADGEKFGWLADTLTQPMGENKLSADEILPNASELLPAHLLFVENAGGIVEQWNDPCDDQLLTWGKNFLFSLGHCFRMKNQESIYHPNGWIFEPVAHPLDVSRLICFSEEANGNRTYYDNQTGKVYLLLGDHAFVYVTPLAGHPEYSFYTMETAATFTDYVELLARQIMSVLA